MTTPTDPLYASQWHLGLLGNIEAIWTEYTGAGIHVGVYDEGVDYNHEDLAANYDSTRHVRDTLNAAVDPFPVTGFNGHGTSCAGIIGAANNGIGGVGVAWGVSLTGVNIDFAGTGVYGSVNGPIAGFLDVVGQAGANFDVMSNSWGSYPGYYTVNGILGGGFGTQTVAAYATLSATGRGGLGTVIVQAAGNDNEDAGGDGVNSTRFTITVAATEQTGFAADYSQFGACILIAAPAAAVTTDMTGAAGADPGNYRTDFNGTSAATPVVAGVISLMLDANAGLGWRDIQNILAASATLTGSAFDATTANATQEGLWFANAGNSWNGGGNHLHINYGYGMVNAYNAVRMAEVWHLFGTAQTSANEQLVQSGLNDFADTQLGDGTGVPFTTTFTIGTNVNVEHAALHLTFAAGLASDLRIVLTSAQGTVIEVANSHGAGGFFDGEWVFGIDGLRGELSAGTWTMQVYDDFARDAVTVRSASLDIYGATSSVNDVYHFTDEFLAMKAFDPARGTVTDADGGIDWLNFAAVAGGVTLNLITATFRVAGQAWGALSGVFEHAIGGDGGDRITGNGSTNWLYGFRGMDTLDGGTGTDRLTGGTGNDTYVVDRQADVIVEGAGRGTADRVLAVASFILATDDNIELMATTNNAGHGAINLTGNALVQSILGNAGVNRLSDGGGAGADSLTGLAGNDVYIIGNSHTTIIEGALGGTADRVTTSVSFTLAADDHIEFLSTTNRAGTGAMALGGNTLAQTILGNDGADRIDGGAGADTLSGFGGADRFAFSTALTLANIDRITDFNVPADTIVLDHTLFGLPAGRTLATTAFYKSAAGLAHDASDRIIYDTDSGALFYDSNGTALGGRHQFATLAAHLALTHLDIFVI
jgi:Ca2+-binding RTX toxin-like protein